MPIIITREPEFSQPPLNSMGAIGRRIMADCSEMGRALILLAEAVRFIPGITRKRALREVLNQMYVGGIMSLSVITVVSIFTGMILALQTGIELRRFSQEAFIGSAVMMSMLREMGPFMTGIILAASVGAAFAAQMGTMVVSEEIAALEVMSIDPIRLLVMPRLVAMAIMTPLLSFYGCLMGVLGGAIVGKTQLGVSWAAYITNATTFVATKDIYVGLFKAFLFCVIVVTVSCHQGFLTTNGAVGVGKSTRRSVVMSFLAILISGFFVTKIFYA
ncbi:MAG: ABC transporter permease [bacterium]